MMEKGQLISKYRSALMGLSALLIVVFHFTEDCYIYHKHMGGWVYWFWNYIGSSSVDAFLFLSGCGLYYAMKKNPDVGRFYRRRLVRLLIPYVLIALPSWVVYDLLLNKTSIWKLCKDVTFLSFFKGGIRWYWYVGLMLVCYLIYPYVFSIVDSARDAWDGEIRLLTMVSAFTVLAVLLELYENRIFNMTNIALLRVPVFLAGCFYGRSSYEKRSSDWKWGILMAVSVIFLMMLPSPSLIISRYTTGAFNVCCCAAIAWIFSRIPSKWPVAILNWFGERSLDLYLVHVTIRKFMRYAGYLTCEYRYELILVAASVVVVWLFHIMSQKLSGILANDVG